MPHGVSYLSDILLALGPLVFLLNDRYDVWGYGVLWRMRLYRLRAVCDLVEYESDNQPLQSLYLKASRYGLVRFPFYPSRFLILFPPCLRSL
jgi:hypothetical protein